jgi:hypothetical protein
MNKPARSAVKSTDIQAPTERVYAFLVDPMNWPPYAVVNLRLVRPEQNGGFKVVTKSDKAEGEPWRVDDFSSRLNGRCTRAALNNVRVHGMDL